jgi:hypothetical protein
VAQCEGPKFKLQYCKKKNLTSQRINNPLNKMVNELNRQLSKEVQLANKLMTKCSTSLAIKQMQNANQKYI